MDTVSSLTPKQIEKQRESFKEKYGIDIATPKGRKIVKNENYRRDCEKFINKLIKIEDRDKPGVVINFNLWNRQEDVLQLFQEDNNIIVLKARQLGLTWEALAFSIHKLIYNSGFSVNTVSQTEGDSKELVRRIDFILRHLPDWLIVNEKAPEKKKRKNITGLTYESQTLVVKINRTDGEPSIFKGFTSSPGAARSFTANIIILDEWAFHENAQAIWDAAYPTINRPTGGQVLGISTGERGTFFEEMWNNANANRNSFTPIFLSWDADPRRNREWLEQTKQDMPHTYRREYPSTPSDAFSAGKGAFFTEWDGKIHVPHGREWYPPGSWRIIMAYDGAYNQACAKWYAISPDGWAICYREYYPSYTTDPEQMEEIRRLSRDPDGVPEQIDFIIADTSCWTPNKDTGKTTVQIGEDKGLRPWRQADKDRIMGWRRLHEWLTPIKDENNDYVKDRHGYYLAKLRFTQACSNTIRLYPGLKENKNKPEDLDGGQEDHCFVAGTKITTINGQKNIEDIRIDDLVLTRKGYKPVIKANPTRQEEVYEVEFTNGKKLIGTGDHLIYTKNRGFIPLDSLRYSDIIKVEENYKEVAEKWKKQNQKLSSIKELNSEDTQKQTTGLTGYIIDQQGQILEKGLDVYIKKYGKMLMEKFLKATIFTTKMAIHLITNLKILNAFRVLNIYQNMVPEAARAKNGWKKYKNKQKNGISLKKAANGTANMVKKYLKIKNQKKRYVNIVAKNLLQKNLAEPKKSNIVLINANLLPVESQELMTKKENVLFVEKKLQQINIAQKKHVQINAEVNSFGKKEEKKTVYNLAVKDQHEYFANGILVHNCVDCDRYFVMTRPRPKRSEKQRNYSQKRREKLTEPRSKVTGY